jgi:hypothetical protein
MTPDDAAVSLLASIGKSSPQSVAPLPGGRNNRVWRVDCGLETFLLKHYFWSPSDPRDRLGQEWAFLEFLKSIPNRKAPAPLAKNSVERFALLEFIHGEPPEQISESEILDAAEFLNAINSARSHGEHLPAVSEACFSIDSHLATTARRMENIARIPCATPDHAEAIEFVRTTLAPLWHEIRSHIEKNPAPFRASELPASSRCLSPSDFGFHNALRQPDGSLRYVDFEYAGWDDPAKTLIDFTNQPDRILPEPLAGLFLEKTIPQLPGPSDLHERIQILMPLYQLKWACICLNPFLPNRTADPSRPLSSQLARAVTMANRAAQQLEQTNDCFFY